MEKALTDSEAHQQSIDIRGVLGKPIDDAAQGVCVEELHGRPVRKNGLGDLKLVCWYCCI